MNLFIRSVTVFSISVYAGGEIQFRKLLHSFSNSLSQFNEKKIVVEVHLSSCVGKIGTTLTPIFVLLEKHSSLLSLRGENAATFKD